MNQDNTTLAAGSSASAPVACSESRTCLTCGRQTCDRQPEDCDPADCKDWKPNDQVQGCDENGMCKHPECDPANDDRVSNVLVRGMYLGIQDDVAAMLNIQDKVKSAQYRVRDEANRITWVHDRLQGLTPDQVQLLERLVGRSLEHLVGRFIAKGERQ